MTVVSGVFSPVFVVRLHKTIMRRTTNGSDAVSQRFSGSASRTVVDLAPFLGDGSSVTTSKSISDPAGGFNITLVDRPDGDAGSFESLYGLIEPMDMIEIRARHGAPVDMKEPPIIMRGFVSDVGREESVDQAGRVIRQVVVNGMDYGKLWQNIQINFLAGYIIGQQYISGFPLFEQFGIASNVTQAEDFAQQVLDKIINPYLQGLMPSSSSLPRAITSDIAVAPATVSPGVQSHQGTIYELLRTYGDVGPWNELFMEDREDGVAMVYRAAPFIKTDGTDEQVQAEAPRPVYIDIPATDIVQRSLRRSDDNVVNFFWVSNPRFMLTADIQRKQEATAGNAPDVSLGQYPNASVDLYGIRLMYLNSEQGAADMSTHDTGRDQTEVEHNGSAAVTFMDARRRVLADSNRDNVTLESGRLLVRGNERIKAGTYLRITTGTLVATYYVNRVTHRMVPYQPFFTEVDVSRGTGFIARVLQSGAPYYEERQ